MKHHFKQFYKAVFSPCKAEVKTQTQGNEPRTCPLCKRNMQTAPRGAWETFSWRAELPHRLSSLLFWFGDPVFLSPCQGLENYPQNKLLDKDLKPSLSKAQTIVRHTHWLQTVFLPLAIIFIMLNYRLFYSHDLIIKCQSMQHQMPRGEIFKSVTLTGKERRACFNFSQRSLPPGWGTPSQCHWLRTSCSSWRQEIDCTAWLLPRAVGSLTLRPTSSLGACSVVCRVPGLPSEWGGLKGHPSISLLSRSPPKGERT